MSILKSLNRALLVAYKRRKVRLSDVGRENTLAAANAIASRAKYCFLITNGDAEWPSARLVEPLFEDDLSKFYIGTNPNLRKVQEINASPYVTLAFASKSDDANLIIHGKASINADPEHKRQHWKGSWRLFFPNGSQGDDYTVITVHAQRMEVMSFKHNVITEPFGLKPIVLNRDADTWQIG